MYMPCKFYRRRRLLNIELQRRFLPDHIEPRNDLYKKKINLSLDQLVFILSLYYELE